MIVMLTDDHDNMLIMMISLAMIELILIIIPGTNYYGVKSNK